MMIKMKMKNKNLTKIRKKLMRYKIKKYKKIKKIQKIIIINIMKIKKLVKKIYHKMNNKQ